MPAISQIDSEGSVAVMNDAYRERLEQYLAAMLQAKQMLSMGDINHGGLRHD